MGTPLPSGGLVGVAQKMRSWTREGLDPTIGFTSFLLRADVGAYRRGSVSGT